MIAIDPASRVGEVLAIVNAARDAGRLSAPERLTILELLLAPELAALRAAPCAVPRAAQTLASFDEDVTAVVPAGRPLLLSPAQADDLHHAVRRLATARPGIPGGSQ